MSDFGWSLPPGITDRMIDEAVGSDDGCIECDEYTDFCCLSCSIPCCVNCMINEDICPDCYDGPSDEELDSMPTKEELNAQHLRNWEKKHGR